MFLIWSQTNLLYYFHMETGFVIYDFRPFVNFGGGVFLENDIGFTFTDEEVLQQLSDHIEDFMNVPKLLLFCCACSGRTYFGVVELPVVRCPLCKGITMLLPWFYRGWKCKDHRNLVLMSYHCFYLFFLFFYFRYSNIYLHRLLVCFFLICNIPTLLVLHDFNYVMVAESFIYRFWEWVVGEQRSWLWRSKRKKIQWNEDYMCLEL